MSLIYDCIAPHAGDLIPETIEDQDIVALTRKSMYAMEAKLEALNPETIVIINPHGFRVQEALSISVAERAIADWSPDVKIDFEMDIDLAHAIADEATESNVPVRRYIYGASGGRHVSFRAIGARWCRCISRTTNLRPSRKLFISVQ